ncbi:YARHG domain-containing protein [Ancylobacter sonchi]|uniref:YARHG domain-containing protein n=1 Tax=Ancylobacter sonchi TaxID=1937790 RepID=UPI001BD3E03E|nr:YARHG domain-containing protein [Ancylobacter sonchi]MBS7532327.1 YARHG domain-containing protein [Ancylobacter sonchi]
MTKSQHAHLNHEAREARKAFADFVVKLAKDRGYPTRKSWANLIFGARPSDNDLRKLGYWLQGQSIMSELAVATLREKLNPQRAELAEWIRLYELAQAQDKRMGPKPRASGAGTTGGEERPKPQTLEPQQAIDDTAERKRGSVAPDDPSIDAAELPPSSTPKPLPPPPVQLVPEPSGVLLHPADQAQRARLVAVPAAKGWRYGLMGLALLLLLAGGHAAWSTIFSPRMVTTIPPGKLRVTHGFVIPDSNTRRLTVDELNKLGGWELYVARNEIFARHGRKFQQPDSKCLQAHFDSWSKERRPDGWYVPSSGTIELDGIEASNAVMIRQYECSVRNGQQSCNGQINICGIIRE